MLTTVGICVLAIFLNVVASIGPPSGVLFIAGIATICAEEVGVRSRREAMTIPTASDAIAMRTA